MKRTDVNISDIHPEIKKDKIEIVKHQKTKQSEFKITSKWILIHV